MRYVEFKEAIKNIGEKHIVSLSGGKDSTAMLLMMIEKGMQIDEIIFCDTTVEFPQMYRHINKLEKYIDRKITVLKSDKDFEYYLLQHKKIRGKYKDYMGYSFPWANSRWCTGLLKKKPINDYLKKYKDDEVIQYIGIAYDEPTRIKDNPNIRYPLFEWKITEKEALEYCYSKGFDWEGLYEKSDRVSCWCCPLQDLKSLRNLYYDFPELWEKLKDWQVNTWKPFKGMSTVEEYEKRFKWEKENPDKKFYWKYIEAPKKEK